MSVVSNSYQTGLPCRAASAIRTSYASVHTKSHADLQVSHHMGLRSCARGGNRSHDRSNAADEVRVGLIDPILAHRAEDVDHERVFDHLDLVREPTGNLHHLAGTHHDLLAVEPESQHAAQDATDLL